jgi:hypothetical protein
LETQETVNSHCSTQQKEQCRRYHNTWFQTILQCNSNKNSMVLAQKQTWRPVEQNIGSRYESTQVYPSHFWQRCQNYTREKRQPFQQMLLGKWLPVCRKLKLGPCLSTCTSINSKWIKDQISDLKLWSYYMKDQETL